LKSIHSENSTTAGSAKNRFSSHARERMLIERSLGFLTYNQTRSPVNSFLAHDKVPQHVKRCPANCRLDTRCEFNALIRFEIITLLSRAQLWAVPPLGRWWQTARSLKHLTTKSEACYKLIERSIDLAAGFGRAIVTEPTPRSAAGV
jgi:hypothetical protein